VKKVIDTPTVQYTTYDKDCPFDAAQSIFDWYDGVWKSDVEGIVKQIWIEKGLNEKGKLILSALQAISDGKISKFAKSKEQYEKECKMFEEWKAKNNAVETNKVIK